MIDALGKVDEFVSAASDLPPEMRSAVFGYVVRYYLLSIPYSFLQYAPFVGLLAILFTGVRLSQNNELVPIVMAGVSLFRVMVPLLIGALLVALSMIFVREKVIPQIDHLRDSLRYLLLSQREERIYTILRMKDEKGRSIRCGSFYPSQGFIEDLTIRVPGQGKSSYIIAREALYQDGPHGVGWYLTEGRQIGGEIGKLEIDFLEGYTFTVQDLYIAYKGQEHPTELSFRELNRLSLLNPERRDYVTLLHYFLTFPLMVLILPLIGLPFVLRFERRATSEGIGYAFLIFFLYFGVDLYLRNLGNQGTLPTLVASWAPVVFFGSLGIFVLDSTKNLTDSEGQVSYRCAATWR